MAETGVETREGDIGAVPEGEPKYATPLRVNDFNATRRQIEHGYPMSPAEREKTIACCRQVRDDPKCPRRTRLAAVKTLAVLDAINLKDLHHTERMQHEDGVLAVRFQRAEEGKPNDSLAIILPPEQPMPVPKWMKDRIEGN